MAHGMGMSPPKASLTKNTTKSRSGQLGSSCPLSFLVQIQKRKQEMLKSFTRCFLVVASVGMVSLMACSKPDKSTAEIDVDAAQEGYNSWEETRIAQIEADDSLSDAEKKQMIEEVKESAKGQMAEVQNLANDQADERGR